MQSSLINKDSNKPHEEDSHYGVRTQPHIKFVWNTHLLR